MSHGGSKRVILYESQILLISNNLLGISESQKFQSANQKATWGREFVVLLIMSHFI